MATGSNEQILLDSILEDYGKNLGSGLTPSKIFELFACEQVLKDRNLSIVEIEDGIVGGGLDGGIDAIFIFADGELISDLEELENIRRNVKIEVFVIQCKTK